MKQIKILKDATNLGLEGQINNWLQEQGKNLKNIEITVSFTRIDGVRGGMGNYSDEQYTGTIVYDVPMSKD